MFGELFLIVIFLLSIGGGAMNDPILWNLRKGYLNCQSWNKDLRALCGYPYCGVIFFVRNPNDIPNWQSINKEALGYLKGSHRAKLAKNLRTSSFKKDFRSEWYFFQYFHLDNRTLKCYIQKFSSTFFINTMCWFSHICLYMSLVQRRKI